MINPLKHPFFKGLSGECLIRVNQTRGLLVITRNSGGVLFFKSKVLSQEAKVGRG